MVSALLDSLIIGITLLLLIVIVLSIKKYQDTKITEFLLLVVVYGLSAVASIADILARYLNSLIIWKVSQLTTQTIFLVLGLFAFRILYYKPPSIVLFLTGVYYGALQSLIILTPTLVDQTDGGVGGLLIIGGMIILSPDFQVIVDAWQFSMTIFFWYSFFKMFREAETKKIKKNIFILLMAASSLLFMTIYEFLEAFILPPIPGTIFMLIALAVLTIQYLTTPSHMLLSPVRIRDLLVVTNTGLPLIHSKMTGIKETSIESLLLAGLLSALDSFIRTWTAKEGFESIRLHDRVLLVESRPIHTNNSDQLANIKNEPINHLIFFLTVDRPTSLIRTALKHYTYMFMKKYRDTFNTGNLPINRGIYHDKEMIEKSFPFMDPAKIVIVE